MTAEHVSSPTYYRSLYWFSVVTAAVAVGLIVVGAMVTSTRSGDAVPDWPLSYGTLAPPMIGGILYEHSHRLVAGLTGICVTILAIWLWIKRPNEKIRWLGVFALVAVIFQAVLGGIRVLVVSSHTVQHTAVQVTGISSVETNRLIFAVIHGCLAQAILGLLFAIALFNSRNWISGITGEENIHINPGVPRLGKILLSLVFIQLVLGAVVRHAGAALSIPDFPLSFGRLIPPFGNLPQNSYMPYPASQGEYLFKVAIHFAHRVLGFTILIFIGFLFYKFRNLPYSGKHIRLLSLLIVIQVLLGGLNIWTAISVPTTVLHVVVGSLILATSVVFVLWSRRLSLTPSEEAEATQPLAQ
ncbi:MAG: hypothetical protein D6748_11170 [Calditrichaeota bacterium]|nr:MAG: hypothetical protein D6748_11170 [Calditrichota bacterium]